MTASDTPSDADIRQASTDRLGPILDAAHEMWQKYGPPDRDVFDTAMAVAFGAGLGAGYRLGRDEIND